jgi:hypothetical protein
MPQGTRDLDAWIGMARHACRFADGSGGESSPSGHSLAA